MKFMLSIVAVLSLSLMPAHAHGRRVQAVVVQQVQVAHVAQIVQPVVAVQAFVQPVYAVPVVQAFAVQQYAAPVAAVQVQNVVAVKQAIVVQPVIRSRVVRLRIGH